MAVQKNNNKPLSMLKDSILAIMNNQQLSIKNKISQLNNTHYKVEKQSAQYSDLPLANLYVDNAIEEVFGSELRRLNAIREQNLEQVNLEDIERLKDGFALLFTLIDNTLLWNRTLRSNLEGIINRASLRAMLIDPAVSIKTKQDIMDNWEEYM